MTVVALRDFHSPFAAKLQITPVKSLAGGPAFDLVDTTKTVGAPLFPLLSSPATCFFEGRVPRAPTAKDYASHPHDTRSRNEISSHPTFTGNW